jgi:hypothetical protein
MAATIGSEFNVHLLAETLDLSPLSLLGILYNLERDTQIISDSLDEEDTFCFSSGGYVEAVLAMSHRRSEGGDVATLSLFFL